MTGTSPRVAGMPLFATLFDYLPVARNFVPLALSSDAYFFRNPNCTGPLFC